MVSPGGPPVTLIAIHPLPVPPDRPLVLALRLPMSDSILAAIIAATATLSASLLQLRFSIARELAARAQAPSGRKKSRAPFIMLFVMIGAAAVAGFALSQWLTESERAAHGTLEHELRERAEEAARTASQLALTTASARAEIEMSVLRRIGSDGIVVMTTVGPCRPALVVSAAPGATAPPGVSSEPAPAAAARTRLHRNRSQHRDVVCGDSNQRLGHRGRAVRPTGRFRHAVEPHVARTGLAAAGSLRREVCRES